MKIWLYGAVMSGKTTFTAGLDDAYIISTDGNASYTFAEDKILRVRDYKELDSAISKLKTINPKWVIVDTTSYLIDYLRFYWCDKNKVEHESDIPYRGYTMLNSFIWESIVTISNTFENVIFISHEQELIEKNKFGREISKFRPVFEERLRDKMAGLMGIIARTVKAVGEDGTAKYELHIADSDDEFGGTRLAVKSTKIPLNTKDFFDNFVNTPKLGNEEPKKKSVIG